MRQLLRLLWPCATGI
uniref:Uncharacterized protein n=1 Tax=Arundo donax TaxID=35708 RepID=A0A0A9AP56_ARUDO